MREELQRIARDILTALEKERTVPSFGMTFGIWLNRVLGQADMNILAVYADSAGEYELNEWLTGVLVRSERYVEVEPGFVQAA